MAPKISKIVRINPNANAAAATETVTNTELVSSHAILEREVAEALDSNDATAITKAQLKLLLAITTQLDKIDWKLWEFYNRLGK